MQEHLYSNIIPLDSHIYQFPKKKSDEKWKFRICTYFIDMTCFIRYYHSFLTNIHSYIKLSERCIVLIVIFSSAKSYHNC